MAAANYTHDLTTYNDCTSSSGWGEATNMTSTDGSGEVDSDLAIHGTQCYSESQRKSGIGSLVFTGTGPTLATNEVFLVWHKFFAPNSLATEANGGIRIAVGSSSSNYYAWYVNGQDTYPYGGWVNYAIDPTIGSPDATQGTPSGVYNTVGIGTNLVNGISKGNSFTIDIIRYGRGEAIFTDGDVGNGYATFTGFALVNDNTTTGRLGLIQAISGGYLWKGLMSLGTSSTSVDFRDANSQVSIDNTKKVSSTFNRIEINNASSRVDWTSINFSSLGTVSKGTLEVIDNATINFNSCSFTDMSTFIFQSNSSLLTTTWRRCEQVTQGGSSIENCIFANSTVATSLLVNDLDLIKNCSFFSDSSNHAIELTSAHAGSSFGLDGCEFINYATSDGSTGNEALYNNSGGAVEISVTNGLTPSVRNGSGASTTFVSSVSLSITVNDSDGSPIVGAYAYIDDNNITPFIMNDTTNSSGIASVTWTGGSKNGATWRVRKFGYKPYYAVVDVPASGTKDIPVTLVTDLQQSSVVSLAAEWTINYTNKTITNDDSGTGTNLPSNTDNYDYVDTVLDLFKWLANDFATSGNMQYAFPINSVTPTVYEFTNGWRFLDQVNDVKYLKGGSILSSDTDALWANLYSLGTQKADSLIYLIQNDTEVSPWWIDGNIDILLNVKSGGTFITTEDNNASLIDGGVWVFCRETSAYYDHDFIDLSSAGRNPISINTAEDLNNTTVEGTIAGYNDITITFGSVTKDLDNGFGNADYDVVIDCKLRPLSEVYEYLKYVARYGSSTTLDGDDGQEYRNANESIWIDVKPAPFGTFAGGKFFGARGVWIENMVGTDVQNYQLLDSNNNEQKPPELYALTLVDLLDNTEVRVYSGSTAGGDLGEIAGIEDVIGNTFQYQYTYVSDVVVNIAIHNIGYVYQTIDNLTLTNSNISIPIKQQKDRWYNNP